jgi:DNA-binding transcriptional regulator YiaG
MNFKEIRELSGMNLKQFSEYFNIPYRTVQNWDLGLRQCPEYVLELIQYKLNNEMKKRQE